MKSIKQLSAKLAAQWFLGENREQRLLDDFDWPLRLSIGKPSAKMFKHELLEVQKHLGDWRQQKLGRVEWQSIKYQSASVAVDMPIYWFIDNAEEWVAATDNQQIKLEYSVLQDILNNIDSVFYSFIIRNRRLWVQPAEPKTVIRSCNLAMQLEPGLAQGRPLRSVSIEGYDTKFLENHQGLLIQLLNIRFAGVLKEHGLEKFLDAAESGGHWLLLKPLSHGLLPFQQLRIRASELMTTELPGKTLIVVENEKCAYQLPKLDDTIAILGAGLNLSWLKNNNFKSKQIIYWGDIDTWGLKMLAMARSYQPNLQPLLMDLAIFNKYQRFTVAELSHPDKTSPVGLSKTEADLYQTLLASRCGRLEQEAITAEDVKSRLIIMM